MHACRSTLEDPTPDKALAAIDDYAREAPKDVSAASLLMKLDYSEDPAKLSEVYRRIVEQYPNSDSAPAAAVRLAHLGKPLDLRFTDLISGQKIALQDFKGKIVVLDFWATWCPGCLQVLPELKELYSKYKDQGVAFIGINLDEAPAQGGLSAMREFVKEYQVPWPQFYQGGAWDSPFSKSLGVQTLPRTFVVDANGNLYDMDALERVEQDIIKLIAKRDGKPPTP